MRLLSNLLCPCSTSRLVRVSTTALIRRDNSAGSRGDLARASHSKTKQREVFVFLASKLWQHKYKCDVRREAGGKKKARHNQRAVTLDFLPAASTLHEPDESPGLRFAGCRSNCLLNRSPGSCKLYDHDTSTQPELFKHGLRAAPQCSGAYCNSETLGFHFCRRAQRRAKWTQNIRGSREPFKPSMSQPESICIRPDSGARTHTQTCGGSDQ